jgi:hypothetical protein
MALAVAVESGDNWNDIFVARDVDGNEDPNSEASDSSDSDYQDEGYRMMEDQSDSEDEASMGAAIQVGNTATLRANLQGKNLVELIRPVLILMDQQGINLPILLDAISWGDADCIQDAKIRYERSAFMNSRELPVILRRWWKPPRSTVLRKKRPRGAACIMECFAAECTEATLNRELEAVASSLISPVGEDIKEETLTSLVFNKMIVSMQNQAPVLWKLLHSMAYTPTQQARNSAKKPDKVS